MSAGSHSYQMNTKQSYAYALKGLMELSISLIVVVLPEPLGPR